MLQRDDIKGPTLAPRDVVDTLLRLGGKNPFGEPVYRLVQASHRFTIIGGEFCDWDESIPVAERGGFKRVNIVLEKPRAIMAPVETQRFNGRKVLGFTRTMPALVPSGNSPIRRYTGLREVLMYPQYSGWLLERWYPAHMFGTREEWMRKTVKPPRPENGEEYNPLDMLPVPELGPYPEYGDYLSVVGTWQHVPGATVLAAAVSHVESEIMNRAHDESPEVRQRKREQAAIYAEMKRAQKFEERFVAFMRDKMTPINSTSLEAGRWRQQMADKAGLRGHFGN